MNFEEAKQRTIERLRTAEEVLAAALEECPNDNGDGPPSWNGDSHAKTHVGSALREARDALRRFDGKEPAEHGVLAAIHARRVSRREGR